MLTVPDDDLGGSGTDLGFGIAVDGGGQVGRPWKAPGSEYGAEAFASIVYPSYFGVGSRYGEQILGPLRKQYVEDQINAIP